MCGAEDKLGRSQQEAKEKIKRGKVRKALKNVATYLNCAESELTADKEPLGYTNSVFRVARKEERYIYKEYSGKKEGCSELFWQKFFGFPKILKEDKEYRIDEYVQNLSLSRRITRTNGFLIELAGRIASVHKSSPPPTHGLTYLEAMQQASKNICLKLRNTRLYTIFTRIEKKITAIYQESLFLGKMSICHNDLQVGNILLLPDGTIQLIDFEHVSMNLPTVEIANLFLELSTNYQKKGAPVSTSLSLSSPQKTLFHRTYLSQTKPSSTSAITPEQFGVETDKMKGVVCYYWILWATALLVDTPPKTNGFDYFCFIEYRLQYLCEEGLIARTNIKEIKSAIINGL
ncbi:choline/ethanolamine kinase [Nematocida displodere]|uniref:Choline/ethanolamine kinase n=1 Tax=Nematocida displodere TaxID=1805483 RepID=A0A177EB68_9MICR|nr:choline/ethanolamine kinase [Nematocida displodere]